MYGGKHSVKDGRSLEMNVSVKDAIVKAVATAGEYKVSMRRVNVGVTLWERRGCRTVYSFGDETNLWPFQESGNRQHMKVFART